MIHWKYRFFILFVTLSQLLFSNNIALIDLIKESGSDFRWNPYRQKGLIVKDDISISFMVESNIIVINNDQILTGVNFYNNNGVIYISEESSKVIYRILKIYKESSDIINDEKLFNIPVIIIDPGHGGRDSGALGNHEDLYIQEKDVVLDISKRVVDKLKDNFKHKTVLLTRSEDIFLTLEERVDIANNIELDQKEAVIYISIHANASLNKKAQGFEVWYLPKGYRRNVLEGSINDDEKLTTIVNALKEDEISLEGQELAKYILDNMDDQIGDVSSNRGLKEEIWFVVRNAKMASVLIEVGFITNKVEGTRLSTDEYLQKVANGIYNGITKFVMSYERDGR